MSKLSNLTNRFNTYLMTCCILLFGFSASLSANEDEVNLLLDTKTAPVGVVFEVVSWDEAYLKTALDAFEKYQKQLKEKFPEIKLAIVTHGNEQFSLTEENKKKYQNTHKQVQRITDSDAPIHICAGHARMRAIDVDTFPEYVSVSASGPAEIENYQSLGYRLIIL